MNDVEHVVARPVEVMETRPQNGRFIWALELVGHSFGSSNGEEWKQVLLKAGELISGLAIGNGGEPVTRERSFRQHCWGFSTLGEAIIAARSAVRALPSLQATIDSSIALRSAIHYGTVEQDQWLSSAALVETLELKDLAHPGQILVSDSARDSASRLETENLPELHSVGSHLLGTEIGLRDVFQVRAPDLSEELHSLVSIHSVPNNLEAGQEIFVDREETIAELSEALRKSRLVTLVGNRGIGKSSVAKRVARKLAYDFQHGIFLVDFAFVLEPTFILETLAVALKGQDFRQGDLLQSIKENLRHKQILLIFDNCDAFKPQIRGLINELILSCRRIQILATCREDVGAKNETLFEVPSIEEPPLHAQLPELAFYDSIRLFVRQAQRREPSFRLTNENSNLVRAIARMLRGVPLAIALAGSRAVEMPLEVMKEELAQLGLSEFSVLDWHEASLQTLQWAYNALSPDDQTVLQELSVIPDSFDLNEIKEYCTLPAERTEVSVRRLLERGLVQQRESCGFTRGFLCEAIRSFAKERMDDDLKELLRERHAKWTRSLVERAPKQFPDAAMVMNKLALEVPNIRCTLEFQLARHNAADPLEFLFTLGLFWFQRGYISEGRVWTHRALSGTDTGFTEQRARGLNMLGNYATAQGDLRNAYTYFHHALSMARQTRNKRLMATVLTNLGNNFRQEGNDDNALSSLHQSLEICRELDDDLLLAKALNNYSGQLIQMGMYSRAEPILGQSMELFLKLGDMWSYNLVRHNMAEIAFRRDQLPDALQFLSENVVAYEQLRDVRGLAKSFKTLGLLEERRGHHQRAAVILGAAATAREQVSIQLTPTEMTDYESCVGNLHKALGKPRFEELWAEGRSMTTASAVRFALEDV